MFILNFDLYKIKAYFCNSIFIHIPIHLYINISKMKNLGLFFVLFIVFFSSHLYAEGTSIQVCLAKDGYTITGKIVGLKDGSKVMLNYRKEDNTLTADTAEVKKEAFKIKGKLSGMTMGFLSFSGRQETMQMFLDNAKLTISGHIDSLIRAKVTGSSEQDLFNKYMKIIDDFKTKRSALILEFKSYEAQGKSKEMADVQDRDLKLQQDLRVQIKDFIKVHNKSLVSVYIILTQFQQNSNLEEQQEVFGYLDKNLQTNRYGKKISDLIERSIHTSIGQTALPISQPTAEGKMISLENYKGKYVFVDFWASWCGPCRKENPHVIEAYQKYKEKGFDVFSVSLDSNKEPWLEAIKADGLGEWTHAADLKGWSNEAAQKYGISFIPANYLLDPQGVIIAKDLRGDQLLLKLMDIFK